MLRPGLLVAIAALACVLLTGPATAQPAETRLRVVLVLDASGSMAGNDPKKVVSMASKMLSDLVDERDHVTVLSFGSSVKQLAATRGSDHSGLRTAIETLGRSDSCTDYAQAFDAAAALFSGAPAAGERRVVLFLTDGRFEPVDARGSCSGFDQAKDEDRHAIITRVDGATSRFKGAGVRVFTVGLGAAPTRAEHSAGLLQRVAGATGGRFMHAAGPRDVPRIFAQIFGALVGAPVLQDALDRGRSATSFTIPQGADRVHVVLVPEAPQDLEGVRMSHDGTPVPFETTQIEARTTTSYRLARITNAAAGKYELGAGDTGRIEVLVIPDVGLSLKLEGVPSLLPEGEVLKGALALRTRTGDEVQLTADFMEHVVFTVELAGASSEKLFDKPPGAGGIARFASQKPLKRGKIHLTGRATHAQGLLDVPAVELDVSIEPRFPMTLAGDVLAFDTMAEEGLIPLSSPASVRLVAPPEMPSDVPIAITLPEAAAKDLVLEPTQVTFGAGQPREVALTLRFKEPRELRGTSRAYTGNVVLTPDADAAKLLVGQKEWAFALDGKLRPWTWARYFEEYKWHLAIALALLLLVAWLVGRAVAQKFPANARIYFVEVGQEFESDSLIKRHASHGAYRSARFKFPLGKNARPLVSFKSAGAGFEVLPEGRGAITIVDDAIPESERHKTAPFRGSWEQRYKLGDQYVVYLARQRKDEDAAAAKSSTWA